MKCFSCISLLWVPALLQLVLIGPAPAQAILEPAQKEAQEEQPLPSPQMRLETMLDQLAGMEDEGQADLLIEEIWAGFYNSGSASVNLLLQRGIASQANGDLDLASDFYSDVLVFAPDFAEGWNRRASLEYARGEYAASIEDLGKTLELQPRHFGALAGLGMVLERLGSMEAAYQAYEDALQIHPFLQQAIDGKARLEKQLKGRQL